MKQRIKGNLLLLFTCFIWGSNYTVCKIGLVQIPPLYYVGMEMLIGGIVLLFLFTNKLKMVNVRILWWGTFSSFILVAAGALEITGLKLISPAKSGFIGCLETIFIPIFCFILFKRFITRNSLYMTLLAFVGLILINHNGISFEFNFGVYLTILAAVFDAIHTILVEEIVQEYDEKLLTIFQLIFGSFLCLIMAFIFEPHQIMITYTGISTLLFTGILSTGLGLYLQAVGLKHVTSTQAGIIYSSIPVFGMLVSMIVLKETFSNIAYIGCCFITLSILNSNVNIIEIAKNKISVYKQGKITTQNKHYIS